MLHTLTPREEKIVKMRYGLEGGSEHTLEEVGRSFTLTRESAFARSKPRPCASCASPLDPTSSSHFSTPCTNDAGIRARWEVEERGDGLCVPSVCPKYA